MGNPRCKMCGRSMIKYGKTGAGKQRFRCGTCLGTQTRTNDIRARDFAAFLRFITGRSTYNDLPGKGRNARRRFEQFWHLWPIAPLVDEVHHVVFVDGIYLAKGVVMLIACTDKHVLGWHIARSEHTSAWQALFSRIAPPDVVVCDGGQGIHKAVKREWSRTRIQRCVFHVFCSVKQKTTTRPRTNAGVELYGLAKALLRVNTLQQASQWLTSLTQWNARWQLMLSERTRYPDGGVDFTHKRLVQAKDTLNTLARAGTMFTFLDPVLQRDGEGPIPATSNQIEGGINAQLREMLRRHRGMRIDRRIKAVAWWCYLHTETVLSPAQILAATFTDEQINTFYQQSANRFAAQQELNQWGTGVNWNDFHTATKWHNNY